MSYSWTSQRDCLNNASSTCLQYYCRWHSLWRNLELIIFIDEFVKVSKLTCVRKDFLTVTSPVCGSMATSPCSSFRVKKNVSPDRSMALTSATTVLIPADEDIRQMAGIGRVNIGGLPMGPAWNIIY